MHTILKTPPIRVISQVQIMKSQLFSSRRNARHFSLGFEVTTGPEPMLCFKKVLSVRNVALCSVMLNVKNNSTYPTHP